MGIRNQQNTNLNTKSRIGWGTQSVNCNGGDYTAINIPDGTAFLTAFAYRTSANSYHFIIGAAQVMGTAQVFLYYDAKNTGVHTVSFFYLYV